MKAKSQAENHATRQLVVTAAKNKKQLSILMSQFGDVQKTLASIEVSVATKADEGGRALNEIYSLSRLTQSVLANVNELSVAAITRDEYLRCRVAAIDKKLRKLTAQKKTCRL